MTATLTSAAQQGTATQPPKDPKPKKTRGSSAFMILVEQSLPPGGERTFVLMAESSTVKAARAEIAKFEDGNFLVVCIRGKFTVKTETARVVKASK